MTGTETEIETEIVIAIETRTGVNPPEHEVTPSAVSVEETLQYQGAVRAQHRTVTHIVHGRPTAQTMTSTISQEKTQLTRCWPNMRHNT